MHGIQMPAWRGRFFYQAKGQTIIEMSLMALMLAELFEISAQTFEVSCVKQKSLLAAKCVRLLY